MKSKTSLFNKGVCKNLLKRFWPLWSSYLILLTLLIPVAGYSMVKNVYDPNTLYAGKEILRWGVNSFIPFLAGGGAAMAMFSYLYSAKSCGMMAALPVKRESMFLTVYLTGILPLLGVNLLVMLISAALNILEFRILLIWLGLSSMQLVTFYSIAVFCAMLTGNIVIMPAVYTVLNLAGSVVESCVNEVLRSFVFGMSTIPDSGLLSYLSPLAQLLMKVYVNLSYGPMDEGAESLKIIWGAEKAAGELNCIVIEGVQYIFLYFAVGILLAGAALLLYKKRRMETAGDTVAIEILKPVFKYCMCFGTALVAAAVLSYTVTNRHMGGFQESLSILALLLAGAAVGYFASEMIMQKSLRVFRGRWKGLVISCCLLTVLVMGAELDVTGFERRIPDPEQVLSVTVRNAEFEEPENIKAAAELQRHIVENKHRNETSSFPEHISFTYNMKDGSSIRRFYPVDSSPACANEPEADIILFQNLYNTNEGIQYRKKINTPVKEENISYAHISAESPVTQDYGPMAVSSSYNTVEGYSMELTPKQAVELYESAILPDIQEGKLGKEYFVDCDEYLDNATNIRIYIELNHTEYGRNGEIIESSWDSFYVTLTVPAERTMNWILENTQAEPRTIRQCIEGAEG